MGNPRSDTRRESTCLTRRKFLPALVLWGDFAVDAQGRLVEQSKSIRLGDWREQGYLAFCGMGRYRIMADFASPPRYLTVDTGGYPVRVTVSGKDLGRRARPPYRFDLTESIL